MFRRFMYGRYGNDQLNNCILIVALALGVASWFTRGAANLAVCLLQVIMLVFWALRAFSRNHFNRRKENGAFLSLKNKAKSKLSSLTAFFRRACDRKHKYFKCPNCKSRLRVPRGRGEITVTCPKCRNRFDKKS